MDTHVLRAAESILDYNFTNPHLLEEALTHASVAGTRHQSNERMEFFGDAVLGMVVCEHLYENFPELLEGDLTKIKSAAVSRRACAKIARELGLDQLLKLGKGMASRNGIPRSVSAAVFESVIAAIHLDGGYAASRQFILKHMAPLIDQAMRNGHQHNFKSALQQFAQCQYEQTAGYILLDENGPDHAKCFKVCVELGGRRFPSSWAATKKQAEQRAALNALLELDLAWIEPDSGEVHLDAALLAGETTESLSSD